MRFLVLLSLLVACQAQTKTYFISRQDLHKLTGTYSVIGDHDSGVLVEAEPSTKAFWGTGYDIEESEYTAYSFDSMERKLKELAETYPTIAKLDTYGTSTRGKPLYYLTITNSFNPEPKPEVMITGATHGNEVITVDTVLGLAERILQGYGTNERFTHFVNFGTLYFIPAVCVDSYIARTREADGVDPNRNYPYPSVPSRNPVNCIKNIMEFADQRNLVGSMDFHSAASMYMYPWAYTESHIPAADDSMMDDLTTRMARTNGFAHGPIATTIYIAPGSSADYYYWKKRTTAIAVEVSHNLAATSKNAPSDTVDENAEATWIFLDKMTSHVAK